MTITASQAEKIFIGINNLNGDYRINAKAHMAILRNAKILAPIVDDLIKVRIATAKECGYVEFEGANGTALQPENDEQKVKFESEMQSVLDDTHEVPLHEIKFDDLNLDENKIPNIVLRHIEDILVFPE